MLDRFFRGAVQPASARSERSRPSLSSWQSRVLVAWQVTLRLRAALLVVILLWMTAAGPSLPSAWALPLGALAAAPGYSSVRYLRIHLL